MLSRLRVLDLCDGGSGLAGRILADLGADVVLVEPPGGAPSRARGPFADDVRGADRSFEFWSVHRGKRSWLLDLGSEAGRDALRARAVGADVWLEDRPPGELAAAGLGYERLAAANPGLIHVSITPFGEIGPKAGWAATDLTVSAASGVMWLTGDEDRAPLTCSVPQAFLHAGGEAAVGALLALAERARSGRGQHVDVSAQTAMMTATQSMVLSHAWNDAQLGRIGGGLKVGGNRLRFVYACRDGYVNFTFLFGMPIGLATARFFAWIHEEGGCSDALRDTDWVAYGGRLVAGEVPRAEHEAVMETIEAFTRTKTKAELLAAAFERRLLVVPLSDGRDLLASKQLAEREFWTPVQHADLGMEVLHPGPFAKLSRTPIRDRRAPPRLGEGGDAVPAERWVPAAQPTDAADAPPLEGLRVLDFTWVYAGPAVTRMLADHGAEVVRLESSTAHDALRAGQPFKDGVPGAERSANHGNVNVGKRSLGLNLRVPEARAVALRLVDWADVVIENYSPKAMKQFGLDYATLAARKPELVMLSSCLSGQTGSECLLAGYGTMGAALAGFGFVTGWPDRPPAAPFLAYTDYVAPRFATAALLAALDHRRRTGEGQHIDLSQAEASIHHLAPAIYEAGVNGRVMAARGNATPHHAPSGVYPARGDDRWIAIAAPDEATWRALDAEAARGWASDARFADAASRLAHAGALDAALGAWTAEREVAELEERLQARGVPAHRVATSRDCFEDPGLAARGHFVELEHPVVGRVPYESSRMRFSRTPARIGRAAPTLGQDNEHVLKGILGLSDEEITELVIAGAIE